MTATDDREGFQQLSTAVRELTTVVRSLDQLLRDEYPKRSEVERRFVTKQRASRRTWSIFLAILGVIVASYFFSIATVSYCFLGHSTRPDSYCSVMPGYDSAARRNDKLIKIFNHLIETTDKNDKRIERLENQR